MYVKHDDKPSSAADLEFIAAARNSIPQLIAEVRRHRVDPRFRDEACCFD
jgi:hypothetical protein